MLGTGSQGESRPRANRRPGRPQTPHRAPAMHEYEASQALPDLPEAECTASMAPSMVQKGFAKPKKSHHSATDAAATSTGFTSPVQSWRHPALPNVGQEPLTNVATRSINDSLLVEGSAGICPKIVPAPSASIGFKTRTGGRRSCTFMVLFLLAATFLMVSPTTAAPRNGAP